MKKMQCEICGSTTIKKIDDSTFECQSCGVQYSKDEISKLLVEITGEVKIDHSKEVDNTVLRAEQFISKGDLEKAEEYYNKALDLDPENERAQKGLGKIENNEVIGIAIEKDIDSETATRRFLSSLKSLPEVVRDIYKEVEIISTTEKYFPVEYHSGKYGGNYSGTACFEREESYTEWEDKTHYNNGQRVTTREPVTKTRTVVDKRPASGVYEVSAIYSYCVSDTLKSLLESTKEAKYFYADNKEKYIAETYYPDGQFSMLEWYMQDNRHDIGDITVDIHENEVQIQNNRTAVYKGCEIEINKGEQTSTQAKNKYKARVKELCERECEKRIGGDYSRNCRYDLKTYKEQVFKVYIPLMVIEYAYKGEFYTATVIMSTKFPGVSMTYPMFESIAVTAKEQEIAQINASKSTMLGAWIAGAVLCGMGTAFFSIFGGFLFIVALILLITCIVLAIYSVINNIIKNNQISKINDEREAELEKIEAIQGNALSKTYAAFLKTYDETASVDEARAAACTVSEYSTDIDEVVKIGTKFTDQPLNIKGTANGMKNYTFETTSEDKRIITIESYSSGKIEVIKVLREELGLSLAEAKNIVDSVPAKLDVKKFFNFNTEEKTIILVKRLREAGAIVKE